MKKLLIALTTALGLMSAGSFAAEASAPMAPTPKAEAKAPAKSPKIHKTHTMKKKSAASKPAAQKAQAGEYKHHHHRHHHHHKKHPM